MYFTRIFSRWRSSELDALEPIRFRAPALDGLERVDVRDRASLDIWCARLDVSPERLIRAVIVVGDKLPDVQHHLDIVA
jgi:hypothetical protein